MSGVERIAAERQRQIEQGRTLDHDREHGAGELARAAVCYATPRSRRRLYGNTPVDWPWTPSDWKPMPDTAPDTDTHEGVAARIRELEKAGALIAAEIDRLEAIV